MILLVLLLVATFGLVMTWALAIVDIVTWADGLRALGWLLIAFAVAWYLAK